MVVYRFKPHGPTARRVALTTDATGKNLPADGAPWQPIGEIDLATTAPWINAPVAEIEATLTKSGYFIWAISAPVMKKRFQT